MTTAPQHALTTSLVLAASLAALPSDTAAQDPTLVAPTYPGAIAVPHQNDDDAVRLMSSRWEHRLEEFNFSNNTWSFLSKDPVDVVRAFYERELGEMTNASLSHLTVPEDQRGERIQPGPYVFAHAVRREARLGMIGVEIRTMTPALNRAVNTLPAVGPVFERLMMGQVSGQATPAEFDAVVGEHKHLADRFYPLTDERSDRGRLLSADEVVFQGCETGAAGGMSQEELMAKMQEAAKTGNLDEASRLSERMLGATGSTSWDDWVGCLEKMDEVGYRTLITIHPVHTTR